jgi:deoxyribodipyrimidine photolyase
VPNRPAWLHDFVTHGLPRYDQRGDPNVEATSCLSAHLHVGTISILEVLLTAWDVGPGTHYARFLDQALTWRELAHNLAFRNSKHRTLAVGPDWARKELDDHSADQRPALYSDQDLEAGPTHDELWNAAQRSLVDQGEIHNDLRMLWGKSV